MRPNLRVPAALLVLTVFTCQTGWSATEFSRLAADTAGVTSSDAGNISMDFENASLKDILKVFSQLSRLNFVASADIETKKATVYFDNVPIEDALNGLMAANSLRYEQQPGSKVFVVYSQGTTVPTLETRIFSLKHTRLSTSPIDIRGQQIINSTTGTTNVSAAATPAATTAATTTAAGSEEGGSGDERGIDKIVQSLLSKNGKVYAELTTNSLIVTDTAEKIAEIEKVIAGIDVPVAQVIIQVYLMEVRKGVIDNIGVEWGGDDGALASITGGTKTTGFPFTEKALKFKGPWNGASEVPLAEAPEISLGTISAENLTATIHAISTLSDTRILAQPRVLTMNNEAAKIELTTDTVVGQETTTTAGNGLDTQTTNAVRSDTGITLLLTPQINPDGTILLYVEPSLITASPSSLFPSDFSETTKRSIKTVARIKNHSTLVIGGLIDKNDTRSNRKVPILGDIPFVGGAFKYDIKSDTDRELVTFITPHIVGAYDSLSRPSATSESGRDMGLARALDKFSDYQTVKDLEVLEGEEARRERLVGREESVFQESAQRSLTKTVDSQMNLALEAMAKKQDLPKGS